MSGVAEALESSEYWSLVKVLFTSGYLEIQVAEGVKSEFHDAEVQGIVLAQARSVDVMPFSRRVAVRFRSVMAFQVYTESISRPDTFEPRTQGVLRRYDRSEYLEYLRSATYLPEIATAARHFSLVLMDDIVDVVVTDGEPEAVEILDDVSLADA